MLRVLLFSTCISASLAEKSPVNHLERAREVTASIVERFEIDGLDLYADRAGGREPAMMWANGIMFSALVGAARHEEKYERPMRKFFDAMDAYWDDQVDIPGYEPTRTKGGNDKYYDDNAWMVLTFLEAYHLTGERRYQRRAGETLDFVLSGWDEEAGGGIWWHERHEDESKNTCVNAPAALGCMLQARVEDEKRATELRRFAKKILVWTVDTLQDEDDGLFYDRIHVPSGRVVRGKLSYNTALMLRCFLALHTHTGEAWYLTEAQRLANSAEKLTSRRTGGYRDAAKWSHLMVEADLELYRRTGDEAALERARRTAAEHYRRWKEKPSGELITESSLARELWLLADLETEVGRAFWKRLDGEVASSEGARGDR